jgi:hypothetical protein
VCYENDGDLVEVATTEEFYVVYEVPLVIENQHWEF